MPNMDCWTPHLESKLHCWHKQQEVTPLQKPAPCLTVSREFGCQAYPFAEALVNELNTTETNLPWMIVGKQVLSEVAKLSGYSIAQIQKAQEIPSSVKAIFAMFLDKHLAEETEIFQHMTPVLHKFAKRGHCIFIGQGAVLATQGLSNCSHVRLVAPYSFRVKRIMETHQLSQVAAAKFIDQKQQQRYDLLRRFADCDVTDPQLYHLILNNSRLPIDSMVKLTLGHLN